ncbi:MAG: TonB-dependent receptor [Sphingorhabdus sp.]|uniref:TonB-dependent receptor n=1 Tax=Sphingorhabdus sp. TaxID=1902408 RepID=UPI003C944190
MRKLHLISATALAVSMAMPAFAQDAPQADEDAGYKDEIVVTAQRQSQSLQEVPIAVSAFSAEMLESQQIENASDLQLTLPNVTFSKGNFTGSSFTIRGIGDLCVGISCDAATAIHLNGTPLLATRLFETEYFDLERVEVLRGPQGTLFGRNATSGVVNFVSAKPDFSGFKASVDAEYGNFNAMKVKGMINVPLGETLAFRGTGFYVKRDGYTTNVYNGNDIDGREMYAIRGSLRWQPSPDTTVDLLGYYFKEDDNRLRIQKQLCQKDPTGVLGCLNNRRDFQRTNSNSTFTGTLGSREFLTLNLGSAALGNAFGLGSLYGLDTYEGNPILTDVREVYTAYEPTYKTDELQAQLRIDHDFGGINAQLTGFYHETTVDSSQDYNLGVPNRAIIQPALNTLAAAAAGLVIPGAGSYFAPIASALIPNGPAGDICVSLPEETGLGAFGGFKRCSPVASAFDRSNQKTRDWSVEGIISSDYDGMFNFLVGGIYVDGKVTNGDYYVNAFAIDYITGLLGSFTTLGGGLAPGFLGTPFFRNNTQEFRLKSYGIFGEGYFDFSDKLKLTVGLRYNNDKKYVRSRSTLASFLVPYTQTGSAFDSPYYGAYDADPVTPGVQGVATRNKSFSEWTGRAVLDYKISDDNLVYLSYSRGYKSGGFNPPVQVPGLTVPDAFVPEQIDAFEIGSKNTFADGAFILNLTGFYYKYKGLQLSRIVARTSINDNVDADIWGLEAEAIIRPDPDWTINLGASYLNTKVTSSTPFINQRDPSGGNPNTVIIKDIGGAFNCVVRANAGGAAAAQAFVTGVNGALGLQGPAAFPSDANLGAATGAFSLCSVLTGAAAGTGGAISVLDGVGVSIKGNSLPQAPVVKFSAGIQKIFNFSNGMNLTPRLDLTYTGESYGNIFNGRINKVEGYAQANAQIQLNGADDRWYVRGYVQNIMDNNSTTGLYLTDQSSGLFTNIFTLDPRRYGIAAGIKF